MRRLFAIAVTSLAVCLVVSNGAMAQGRAVVGGFGGGLGSGGFVELLQLTQVQKELKLSAVQIAKMKELRDASRPPQAARGQRGAGQTSEQRTAAREERQKQADETDKKLHELLKPEQIARLKQMQLWVQESRALTKNATVIKELGLTEDQQATLVTINDEAGKKRHAIAQGLGRGATNAQRAKAHEEMTALEKDTYAQCTAVLTDDQTAKLAAMKGEKFELDLSHIGAGPGQRRGNNNNNN